MLLQVQLEAVVDQEVGCLKNTVVQVDQRELVWDLGWE